MKRIISSNHRVQKLTLRKVQRPVPILLKRMQIDFATGNLNGGLELELARRISEVLLQQLGEPNR